MNHLEAIHLLARVAAYDHRQVGTADVDAWTETLADITHADATQAVDTHYRRTRTPITPADVYAEVRRIRRDRLDHAGRTPQPPVDPDDVHTWLAARRAQLAAIADGQPITRSHPTPAAAPPAAVQEGPRP